MTKVKERRLAKPRVESTERIVVAEVSSPRCQECGDTFDPEFSRGGVYCFSCSVHVACACADEND